MAMGTANMSFSNLFQEKVGFPWNSNYSDFSMSGFFRDNVDDYFDIPGSLSVNVNGTPTSNETGILLDISMNDAQNWKGCTVVSSGISGNNLGFFTGQYGSISINTLVPITGSSIAIQSIVSEEVIVKGSSTFLFLYSSVSAMPAGGASFTKIYVGGQTLLKSSATYSNNQTYSWGLGTDSTIHTYMGSAGNEIINYGYG